MNPLYVMNLAVALLLLLWPAWFAHQYLRLKLLNPITIPLLVSVPVDLMKLVAGPMFLISQGLSHPGYQFAVAMNNVLVISQIAGTIVFFKLAGAVRVQNFVPFKRVTLSSQHLRIASLVFLGLFLTFFCILASRELGILEWIKNPRTGYQLYRVGQGHWYALALNCLSVSAILSYANRPTVVKVMFKMVFFVGLSYFLGSKGFMLAMFTAALVVLSFARSRHITKLFVFGAPLVALLLVWNLYLALSDAFELQSIFEYFDYYLNAADYYQGALNGEIPLFYGLVFLTSSWAYVPRALVPDKPFVYGILHVNEIFYPGQAELTNTPAFGGAVEQYADFGVIGVIIFGFFSSQALLNALLWRLAFRNPGVNFSRLTIGSFMVMLALAGPLFGIYFPGGLYLLLLLLVMLGILLVRILPLSTSSYHRGGTMPAPH